MRCAACVLYVCLAKPQLVQQKRSYLQFYWSCFAMDLYECIKPCHTPRFSLSLYNLYYIQYIKYVVHGAHSYNTINMHNSFNSCSYLISPHNQSFQLKVCTSLIVVEFECRLQIHFIRCKSNIKISISIIHILLIYELDI